MEMEGQSATIQMQLLRMGFGVVIQQALHVAAKLGIADLLKDGERSTSDLATVLHVNEDALYRVLRFLAGQGVFHEAESRRFANTPLSECLRSDVLESVRSIMIFRGSRYFLSPFTDFLYSIESGMSAREKTLGIDGFEFLRRNPEEARIFDDSMTAMSALWAPSIAAAYDFGSWGSLMDVGGGNGLLLAAILRKHRDLCAVLADQAHVLERARERGFLAGELSARVQFAACDFFQAIPSGCRAYLMKNVIHDWDDDRARQILFNCRRVVPDDGGLLLVEYSLGKENAATLGKTIDVVMLAVTGGRERTVEEYRKLFASGGFRLNRTIAVSSEVMILEALPI